MSLEVWDDEGAPSIDIEAMERHGWDVNEECTMARRYAMDGEAWIPIQDAWDAYRDWLDSE